jgi:hypothetical protein
MMHPTAFLSEAAVDELLGMLTNVCDFTLFYHLSQGPGLRTVAPSTLSIPGRWAGCMTREIE